MKPAVGAFLANFQVWSKGFLEGRRQKIDEKREGDEERRARYLHFRGLVEGGRKGKFT